MLDKIFSYQDKEVRTIYKDEQTWFVAKDVCDILELSNARKALKGIDNIDLTSLLVTSGFQKRRMNCVNEPGLYQLIFQSRKSEAKAFKRWVTSEVLPAIRRYGFYKYTKFDSEELRYFIERFFPGQIYGEVSDKTGLRKLIPVCPHFRSCKIAKVNSEYTHPDLFNNQTKEEINENNSLSGSPGNVGQAS